MKKTIFYSAACLLLASCATIADSQTVLMTVKTPGAENAKCHLENKGHKVIAYTDETVRVMKSPHDFVVRCTAPGNREKTVLVKREVNDWVFVNVANGFVPGAAYDVLSRGVFDYPNEVVVDFNGEPFKPYPLPEYATGELGQRGYQGNIEHYGPNTLVTEGNRYNAPQTLQKKESLYSDFSSVSGNESNVTSSPSVSYDPTEEDK